jgi:hypothetical protein
VIPANPMSIATSATDRHRLDQAFAFGARVPALPHAVEAGRRARSGRPGRRSR